MLDEVRTIVGLLMKRPITEEIAMQVKAIPGYKHLEISNGEWVGLDKAEDEMTTGEEHGWIETLLLHFFTAYALQHKAGRVYPGDVTFVRNGERSSIRIMQEPDVAFVAQANVTPTQGFIYRAPDLAVEIISPSQDYDEMIGKRDRYFQYGTHQVWIVLPTLKQIEVHLPDGSSRTYKIGQTIPGGDLLPGFTLDVSAIFST